MIHIEPMIAGSASAGTRRLPFYLALEEWVARALPPAEYFFTWRVNPTVIFGRNQDIDKEVDRAYCDAHGIEVYRRRSGGGCVYADLDNLMLSYITPSTDVSTTFASYTQRVADALCALGVNAAATGRNDVTIDGAKVSGNAFYHLPGRSIVHGTLLFSTDMDNMMGAITPSKSKLESKSVKSVASRIATLQPLVKGLTIEDLEKYLVERFCDSQYQLTDADLAEVEEIERRYYEPTWIYGERRHNSGECISANVRIEGVGELAVSLRMSGGRIAAADINGDYFLLSDLDSGILDHIKGCRLDRTELASALDSIDTSTVISGLSTSQFIDTLISAKSEI